MMNRAVVMAVVVAVAKFLTNSFKQAHTVVKQETGFSAGLIRYKSKTFLSWLPGLFRSDAEWTHHLVVFVIDDKRLTFASLLVIDFSI